MNNKQFSQILDTHGINDIEDYLKLWLNDFKNSNYNEATILIRTATGMVKRVISILEKEENLVFYLDKIGLLIVKKVTDDNNFTFIVFNKLYSRNINRKV